MSVQYKTFDSDAKALGQSYLGFINCINKEDIQPYLEKHNLSTIEPDKWYPLQSWLDVLSDIANSDNSMMNFVAIGTQIAQEAPFPPVFDQLPISEVLKSGNESYNMQHQGNAGEVTVEVISDNAVRITCKTPYPGNLLYGTYYGIVKRFASKDMKFTIQFDPETPTPLNNESRDLDIFNISWK